MKKVMVALASLALVGALNIGVASAHPAGAPTPTPTMPPIITPSPAVTPTPAPTPRVGAPTAPGSLQGSGVDAQQEGDHQDGDTTDAQDGEQGQHEDPADATAGTQGQQDRNTEQEGQFEGDN
ncbi:MAG TPA: hypothetical protein VGS17_07705 [Candidatus Limnocylindria bacterium]|nr:hypothetical protein [Candidatus Limnocylindria bacterium]